VWEGSAIWGAAHREHGAENDYVLMAETIRAKKTTIFLASGMMDANKVLDSRLGMLTADSGRGSNSEQHPTNNHGQIQTRIPLVGRLSARP
jgi:hypothetical protein